jgi:hypothetical protein
MISALEITVRPDHQGSGLSGVMPAAMRDNAGALGHPYLVAPVRPTGKHLVPRMPIDATGAASWRVRPSPQPP